jgi:hypothetical protein
VVRELIRIGAPISAVEIAVRGHTTKSRRVTFEAGGPVSLAKALKMVMRLEEADRIKLVVEVLKSVG